MKVKDQIKARREQLGISLTELSKRIGVSAQAVRFWESGRSYPTRSKIPALESALSFALDWSEGEHPVQAGAQVTTLIDPKDIDLLLVIARLPPAFKDIMFSLAKMHLSAILGQQKSFQEVRKKKQSIESFNETGGSGVKGRSASKKRASSRAA